MQSKSHSIIRLQLHDKNERPASETDVPDPEEVDAEPGEEDPETLDVQQPDEQAQSAPSVRSMLEAYFLLNEQDHNARQYYYWEIPEHYKWNRRQGKWEPRMRKWRVLGRIYSDGPKRTTLSRLRLLLLHVKAATCFDDLKVVNGHQFDTYDEACLARGLIIDDTGLYLTCY